MGSHFIRGLYHKYPHYKIVNLDLLTYAGNPENLADIEALEAALPLEKRRYEHVRGDVADAQFVNQIFSQYRFAQVYHFAAESHVDRSIFNFGDFVRTNIEGTRVIFEAVRFHNVPRMVHISTDEVYGNVPTGFSLESAPMNPSNPYAASKASADMLVRTYAETYKLPIVAVRSGNNYGTHQYPEKLIPLTITNLIEGKTIPVHGTGEHKRSWVHVHDFCRAVDLIAHTPSAVGAYNIAGEHKTNLEVIELVARSLGRDFRKSVSFVNDRPIADLRYAPHAGKIERELGWRREHSIEGTMPNIVKWYLENGSWWQAIKEKKEFMDHYEKQSKALWY